VANLCITTRCNQHCSYCFARDHVAHRTAPLDLAEEQLEWRLALLDRAGVEEVRLIGGEPTLHPRFPALVQAIAAQGRRIVVFSNGIIPAASLAALQALPASQCGVLVNTAHPSEDGQGHARRLQTLAALGQRASLSFNIHRADVSLDYLPEVIAETGCAPAVRLGLAHPCLSGANQSLHPKQYPSVAPKIVALAANAARRGIHVHFDCGFVRCMFTVEQLAALEEHGVGARWKCGPIVDIDVSADALPCFALARDYRYALRPDMDLAVARASLEQRLAGFRRAGVYRECSACSLKASGECAGGCLSATIRRFRDAAPIEIRTGG
jgi:sulfatase maturation enzyme AslB (radical SAM superfamily)